MTEFTIYKNEYLNQNVTGYFHTYYTGYGNPNNPNYLNTLKNTFNNTHKEILRRAACNVVNILIKDIPQVIQCQNMNAPVCVCVPRSRANMAESQMHFQISVSVACDYLNSIENGTSTIVRKIDTATTHLARSSAKNDGPMPYPGITNDTCYIDKSKIYGREVLLIDDIYTRYCNIDEDCIQALLSYGAKRVVFYSVAYTKI